MPTVSTATPRRSRGFTLLETVVVIVVVGVLAAVSVVGYRAVTNRSHDAVTLTEVQSLAREAAALARFSHQACANVSWPDLLAEIDAAGDAPIADEPAGAGEAGWAGATRHEYSWRATGTLLELGKRSATGRVMTVGVDACADGLTDGSADPGGDTGEPNDDPNAPQNLTAESGDSTVTLTWDEPTVVVPGATYEIIRDGVVVATSIAERIWVDPNVTNGEVYEYQVVTVGEGGERSTPSNMYEGRPFSTRVIGGSGGFPSGGVASSDNGLWHVFVDPAGNTIHRSGDFGETWDTIVSPAESPAVPATGVDIDDQGRVYAVQGPSTYRWDGDWTTVRTAGTRPMQSVNAVGDGEILITQQRGYSWGQTEYWVDHSTNSGSSWTRRAEYAYNADPQMYSTTTATAGGFLHSVTRNGTGTVIYRRMNVTTGQIQTIDLGGDKTYQWDPRLLVNPAHPETLYVFTRKSSGDNSGGFYLRRSTDHGATWQMTATNTAVPMPMSGATHATLGADGNIYLHAAQLTDGFLQHRVVPYDPLNNTFGATRVQATIPADSVPFSAAVANSASHFEVSFWIGVNVDDEWELRHVRGGYGGPTIDCCDVTPVIADADGAYIGTSNGYGAAGHPSPSGNWIVTYARGVASGQFAVLRSTNGILWENLGIPDGRVPAERALRIDDNGTVYFTQNGSGYWPDMLEYMWRDGRWWAPTVHHAASHTSQFARAGWVAFTESGIDVSVHDGNLPVQYRTPGSALWESDGHTGGSPSIGEQGYMFGERLHIIDTSVGYPSTFTFTYRIVDAETRTVINPTFPGPYPFTNTTLDFVELIPRPGNPDELYLVFATSAGETVIWRSDDGGTSWDEHAGVQSAGRSALPIAAGVGNDDKMWVAFSDTSGGNARVHIHRRGFDTSDEWSYAKTHGTWAGATINDVQAIIPPNAVPHGKTSLHIRIYVSGSPTTYTNIYIRDL